MEYVLREFRLGDPHDAELLAAMWNASDHAWPGGWTRGVPETAESVLERTRRADRIAIFVVEVDGEIVGYCDMSQERGRDDMAYLPLLNVRPDFHGKGLGKALILKVLERTVELGYKQLTLDTWPGNERAIPLYKKTGFFWVPEASVWMQNYIPTALSMPIARPFFARHDWYRCFKRGLEVVPDDIEWNGIKVFPYRFEEGGDRFVMWIDRQAEAPTAVETNDLYAACIVGKEEVVCGLEQVVRWEIVNRRGVGEPLRVTLMAQGEEGIGLSAVESFEVKDSAVIERSFTISPDVRPKEPGLPAHRIRSTLIINGVPLSLGSAVKPVQPVEIQFSGQMVVPDKPDEEIIVKLKSNLDFPVRGKLLIDPHPSLHFDRLSAPFAIEPGSWTSCAFRLRVHDVGAFVTRMRVVLDYNHRSLTARPVTFRTVPLDSVFAWTDEEEKAVVIEAPTFWVRLHLRGGRMNIYERMSGREVCCYEAPELGPPFIGWRRVSPVYAHRLERRDGRVSLTLIMPSDSVPGVTVERTVTVGAGNFIRVDHRILNTTNAAQKLKLRCHGWSELRGRLTLPLREGLLHEPVEGWGGFPLHNCDLPRKTGDYAESWFALEESGLVVGMVWDGCEECKELELQFDLPEMPPQSHHDMEPLYLVAARGNWEVVRQLWRWLKQPSTVREEHSPIALPVLSAGFEPGPLLITRPGVDAKLVVHNRRGKALDGGWRIVDCKLGIDPDAGELRGVKLGSPFAQRVTVAVADLTPRVEIARLAVSDEVTTREFTSPVIILGDARRSVDLDLHRSPGTPLPGSQPSIISVDNGYFSFTVVPAFLSSITALERGGVNHLNSAYPETRPHSWMNPWFGGVHPFLGWAGNQQFAGERFVGEPVERVGGRGIVWRGAKVSSDLQHKDSRWLRMEVEYLTVGGSNALALVQRFINRTDAPQEVRAGMCVWLAVGGSVAGNVLYYMQERPRYEHTASADEQVQILRHRRRGDYSFETCCGRWAAVESQRTGDVLTLLASHPDARVHVNDEGKDGINLQVSVRLSLMPSETKEVVSWLIVVNLVAEAQDYRALGKVWELP